MTIRPAARKELHAILILQKTAYIQEAEIYSDYTIPPLTQSLGAIEDDFKTKVILVALVGRKIVGSVRGQVVNGTGMIGKLIVDPVYQNQGIGTRLLKAIEKSLAAPRYELFTGEKSRKNLYLYGKHGYTEFKREKTAGKMQLVYLEKK